MRDHLATLQAQALARGDFDAAAGISERRLSMSSLEAPDVARYMPPPMQEMGEAIHRAASRFSIAAANAGANGNVSAALDALASVTAQCVACHAAYRLD